MTNDHDMKLLSDELHDLADDIAPSSAAAARDRARRGIARHSRNRRAAAGAGAAVVLVVVAAAAFVAVDRDTNGSQRPIGTTTPSVSVAPTTTSTTTTSTTLPGSPIVSTIPPLGDVPAATASYSKAFAWGTADDQVAFHTPQGEGVSGGPVAFTADSAGNIVMLDHSSSRIVRFENGSAAAHHLALADPGVISATFDDQGRLIVRNSELAVFDRQGQKEGAWQGGGALGNFSGLLSVDGERVYESNGVTRTALLRDTGSGYAPVQNGTPEPTPITVDMHAEDSRVFTMTASETGRQYRITASEAFTHFSAARLLPDVTLAFVLQMVSAAQSPDQPLTYVVGRISRSGQAQYEKVTAASGYLVNGPEFAINDDGLAVMGSTTTSGVNVSYYPFD